LGDKAKQLSSSSAKVQPQHPVQTIEAGEQVIGLIAAEAVGGVRGG